MGPCGILIGLARGLVRVSRLERSAARPAAALVAAHFWRAAAARQLDTNLHGERRTLSGAILPAVSAWRAVWQADGRQRFGLRGRGFHDQEIGERHIVLAVVLAGAVVTYGGVSLFVAFFVLVPMAQTLFRARRSRAA